MIDLTTFAGSRPGGRVTFLLRGKKVTKEARPATPALRASLPPGHRAGRRLNSLRSDNAAGPLRPGSPPLGGAEGRGKPAVYFRYRDVIPVMESFPS